MPKRQRNAPDATAAAAEAKHATETVVAVPDGTYLGLVTNATEWQKGGGINLTIKFCGADGSAIRHQNGSAEAAIMIPMPLEGPKFVSYTVAIFPELERLEADANFGLEDLRDRFVYVTVARDTARDMNRAELAKWGPRLNVVMLKPIPAGEREKIRAISLRVLGREPLSCWSDDNRCW